MDKKTISLKAVPQQKKTTSQLSKAQAKEKQDSFPGVICKEAIAVRAYFISERRRQLGWDGDEVTDWTTAEQQLQAEIFKKPVGKKR